MSIFNPNEQEPFWLPSDELDEIDEALVEDENWTDKPDYNDQGEPNE